MEKFIRIKPVFFKFIPLLNKPVANIIYPYIFLHKKTYYNLLYGRANPYEEALLIHELTHLKRQSTKPFSYFIKYLFSLNFRVSEEKIAIKNSILFLKRKKIKLNLEKNSNIFDSNLLYFFPLSKMQTLEDNKQFWRNS